jgi:hypothetical protein
VERGPARRALPDVQPRPVAVGDGKEAIEVESHGRSGTFREYGLDLKGAFDRLPGRDLLLHRAEKWDRRWRTGYLLLAPVPRAKTDIRFRVAWE